jgi:peptide/nickel transport system permease protein
MPTPRLRHLPAILLAAVALLVLLANFVAPHSYATQFRDAIASGPSLQFPLGTDALGRDRLSRTLYGARISLLCAPTAAMLSVLFALTVGLLAGSLGRRAERIAGAAADLCLSLPWIFALLAVRAVLPLNASPMAAVLLTFGLLGLLGWAGPCRMIIAAVKRHLRSDFALLATASGCPRWRIALVHIAPNLLPLALAQLLITIPGFLLAEANLGLLGLGIPEPLPSWGGMLRELESLSTVAANPIMLVPALLLFLVISLFNLTASADEYTA